MFEIGRNVGKYNRISNAKYKFVTIAKAKN